MRFRLKQDTTSQCHTAYLYVLFCASDILSTSFPGKDTLLPHKGNLQQRDRILFIAHIKKGKEIKQNISVTNLHALSCDAAVSHEREILLCSH